MQRHMQHIHTIGAPRCPIRKSFINPSGSMCTAYSTLGNLQGDESVNAILLVIYMVWCFKNGIPLLAHENVKGFEANHMVEFAEACGYVHVAIACKPIDVGVHVGRPRK